MHNTSNLELPLLQPSQAQKHVTVNEALARLDTLAMLVLEGRGASNPPANARDGEAWALSAAPDEDWAGQGGKIAIRQSGGWVFATPRAGWRAWVAPEGCQAVFDGSVWRGGAMAVSPSGAGSFFRIKEFDHAMTAGTSSQTEAAIPANTLLFAVTARVLSPLTGTQTSWRLGVAGALDRFGSGLSPEQGAFARGLLSTPTAHYAATPLRLTATGGSFSGGGSVRIALHYYEPSIPGL
ncbi:MAG: DUF2793 domain-containing protein [Alkalilacustris sp.]